MCGQPTAWFGLPFSLIRCCWAAGKENWKGSSFLCRRLLAICWEKKHLKSGQSKGGPLPGRRMLPGTGFFVAFITNEQASLP